MRILRLFVLFFFSLVLFLFFASPAYALKRRASVSSGGARPARGVSYSSARLSRATNSVVVTFFNLANIRRVDYTLSYSANGIPQGVVGALVPSGQATDSRDLYFGTCSHGVCTAHRNIRYATLVVTTNLTSGGTHSKRYRIRI